jgi:hypothetical protein
MALKVVLDTNVLVSGLIVANGPSGRILDAVRQGNLTLVTSPQLLQEFSDVVARPRIARKYPKVAEQAETVIDFFRANATLVSGQPVEAVVAADPDDDAVIACAVQGEAEYIVSGDEHLLNLGQHGSIRIVTPSQFIVIAFPENEDAGS